MKEIEQLTSRLLDIEMPAAPPVGADYTLAMLLFGVVITVTCSIYFIYRHSSFTHKKSLSKIKYQLTTSVITPKEASYKLADLLKSIHKTKHLTEETISQAAAQKKQWPDFLSRLMLCRYKNENINKHDVIMLINESTSWLKARK